MNIVFGIAKGILPFAVVTNVADGCTPLVGRGGLCGNGVRVENLAARAFDFRHEIHAVSKAHDEVRFVILVLAVVLVGDSEANVAAVRRIEFNDLGFLQHIDGGTLVTAENRRTIQMALGKLDGGFGGLEIDILRRESPFEAIKHWKQAAFFGRCWQDVIPDTGNNVPAMDFEPKFPNIRVGFVCYAGADVAGYNIHQFGEKVVAGCGGLGYLSLSIAIGFAAKEVFHYQMGELEDHFLLPDSSVELIAILSDVITRLDSYGGGLNAANRS